MLIRILSIVVFFLVGACVTVPDVSAIYDRFYVKGLGESYSDFHQRVMKEKCPLYSATQTIEKTTILDPSDPLGERQIIIGIRSHDGANPFGCQML